VALNRGANAVNIPAILADRAAAHGGDIILRKKDRGIWKAVTWAELAARARDVGMGLKAIGFRPGDVACTLAETRPEFVYADLGILGAGGVSGGIHPAEEADPVRQVLCDSRCNVLFVENEEQLDKVLTVRERCPALRRIVVFDMKGLRDFADPMCESFETFCSRGAEYDRSHGGDWERGIAAIAAEHGAVLLVPLGGATRSRILSHGDALHLIADARSLLPEWTGNERLALLPMCSATERVFGLYLALDSGTINNYLENPDTVMENLQEVKPTVLVADPQIWRFLHARIGQAAAGATRVQRLLYGWAIGAGQRGGVQAILARWLVLRTVRRELGLGRLRLACIDAALPPEVERWAAALGIAIQRIDGQATRGIALDARCRAPMQEAYGTS